MSINISPSIKFAISPRQMISIKFQFTRLVCSTRILLKNSSSSSNRWLNRQHNDFYTRKAKEENLKSRAAFKLLQIDEKFHLFSKNKLMNVLDLGAAPGAWNQVAIERSAKGSKVLGVDLLPYQPPIGASAIQGNILNKETHRLIKDYFILSSLERKDKVFEELEVISASGRHTKISESSVLEKEIEASVLLNESKERDIDTDMRHKYPVDVVLSDMMANTSGLAIKDHGMSMDLCDAALIAAIDLLKKDGSLVMKFFTGEEDKSLEKRLNQVFRTVRRFKPKACRLESKESYFICLKKKDYEFDKIKLFTGL
ncbi:hypothetical protein CANINC_003785 [Pichia inconspicua]|uniref:rRNA methyltransferase 2, mitochondrial n=1 Tax=Pichia inconspicua TaxID=52247 RepID=A0A4V4NFC7_9ASCO|nr:hypothetical protein CANINC_003785 [[Candida] inconspicua]